MLAQEVRRGQVPAGKPTRARCVADQGYPLSHTPSLSHAPTAPAASRAARQGGGMLKLRPASLPACVQLTTGAPIHSKYPELPAEESFTFQSTTVPSNESCLQGSAIK